MMILTNIQGEKNKERVEKKKESEQCFPLYAGVERRRPSIEGNKIVKEIDQLAAKRKDTTKYLFQYHFE